MPSTTTASPPCSHACSSQDLLHGPDQFVPIFSGCDVVFHTASPVVSSHRAAEMTEDDFVRPARDGTHNVMAACHVAGVKSVVVTSSTATVFGDKPPGSTYTPDDWLDVETLRAKRQFYAVSKVLAEKKAYAFQEKLGAECTFRLATVLPCMVGGPSESRRVSAWRLPVPLERSWWEGCRPLRMPPTRPLSLPPRVQCSRPS